MRALLFATGEDAMDGAHVGVSPLRHVLDKPLLQHTLERLADAGVRQFDVVACCQASQVEELLEDGTRWGVRIRVHLVRDPRQAADVVHRLDLGTEEQEWMVGHADRLPSVDFAALPTPCSLQVRGEWTGWARLTSTLLGRIPRGAGEQELARFLEQAHVPIREVDSCSDCRTPASLVQANMDALRTGDGTTVRQREPGIWVGRGAVVHKSARLEAPVFIGHEVIVGAGAVVGPWAVVGSNCVVDEGAQLERAVITQGTYVGRDLEVREAIVSRRCLHHVALDTAVCFPDPQILGDLEEATWSDALQGLAWRSLGALLTVLLLPAVLWSRRTGRGRVLSSLPRVARGEIRLVGLPQRSPQELEELPAEWREICEHCPPGLLTPAQVLADGSADPEVCFTHEAWYAAHRGLRTDLSLLARWLWHGLRGPAGSRPPRAMAASGRSVRA